MPVSESTPDLRWVGDRHLLLRFDASSDEESFSRVRQTRMLLGDRPPAGLIDMASTDATLLLMFDAMRLRPDEAEDAVRRVMAGAVIAESESAVQRVVDIPVCYDEAYAPDIQEVASLCGLSKQEVASLHCGGEYTVRFLGFMPGFGYLSGLPEKLATPRLPKPRIKVPAGSVAIAGDRTGVYPFEAPGGWRLIGRTPFRMFDTERDQPALLAPGDRVRFVAIDAARFHQLKEAL